MAKESRFTDSEDKKPEFHKVFCETQAIAQKYTHVFNEPEDDEEEEIQRLQSAVTLDQACSVNKATL